MDAVKVRRGDRLRARRDVHVGVMTVFQAPLHTGGDRTLLPEGAVLVSFDPQPGATVVNCYPEHYDALESHLVPEAELRNPRYRAYYIGLSLADIADDFEVLEPLEPRPETDRLPRDYLKT
jgi:hypothetical protein